MLNTIKVILEEPNLATDALSVNNSRDMYAACIDMSKLMKYFVQNWSYILAICYWNKLDTRDNIELEPLTDFLDSFGGWPMTLDSWNESHFDWKEATVATTKIYSAAYLINFYNDIDQMNTNHSSIYVSESKKINLYLKEF